MIQNVWWDLVHERLIRSGGRDPDRRSSGNDQRGDVICRPERMFDPDPPRGFSGRCTPDFQVATGIDVSTRPFTNSSAS